MQRLGYECAEMDDAYAAMAEVCQRPLAYRVLILSLTSLYPEELQVISSIKRRFSHIDIFLTHTDGRQTALVEAMRRGADGLLSDEGLDRIRDHVATAAIIEQTPLAPPAAAPVPPSDQIEHLTESEPAVTDPVLSADELRALLHEPTPPPAAGEQ